MTYDKTKSVSRAGVALRQASSFGIRGPAMEPKWFLIPRALMLNVMKSLACLHGVHCRTSNLRDERGLSFGGQSGECRFCSCFGPTPPALLQVILGLLAEAQALSPSPHRWGGRSWVGKRVQESTSGMGMRQVSSVASDPHVNGKDNHR